MSNDQALEFERVFVLFNPASTGAKRSQQRIAELKKLYPGKVNVVKTSPKGRAGNQAIMRKLSAKLNQRTLLGVAAGDGTVGLIIEALTATGRLELPTAARQAPVLPLWGGNANDLAYMLNGTPGRLAAVLGKADIIPIYPLRCAVTTPAGVTSCYSAACYIAFGVSGRMAHTLNGKTYRKNAAGKGTARKIIHELRSVTRTFRRAKRFGYTVNGREHRVYELLFANGSRMAKVDRLPISLVEPYFYTDHLKHSSFVGVIRKLFAIARSRHAKSERRAARLHTKWTFTLHNQVWAQFDGEPRHIPAGSTIVIERHSRPFHAVASALRQPIK